MNCGQVRGCERRWVGGSAGITLTSGSFLPCAIFGNDSRCFCATRSQCSLATSSGGITCSRRRECVLARQLRARLLHAFFFFFFARCLARASCGECNEVTVRKRRGQHANPPLRRMQASSRIVGLNSPVGPNGPTPRPTTHVEHTCRQQRAVGCFFFALASV
jgi:hypothetical protein